MQVKVKYQHIEPCRMRLELEVPPSMMEEAYESAKKETISRTVLPGFRRGKVPLHLVEKKFKHSIEEKALEKTLSEAYRFAIKQENLRPYGPPQAEKVSSYKKGEPLKATLLVDRPPSCRLPNALDIEVVQDNVNITEDDVELEIKNILMKRYARYKDVDTVTKKEDIAKVNIHFLEDALKHKSASGQVIAMEDTLSTDLLALRDELYGMKVGDKKTLKKTFSEDFYDAELRHKTTSLEIEVTHVQTIQMPELTEDIIKELGYASQEAMKKDIHTQLKTWANTRLKERMQQDILKNLIPKTHYEIPQSAVEAIMENLMKNLLEKNYGNNQETLKDSLHKEGKTLKDLSDYHQNMAYESIQRELLLSELIEKHQIDIDEKEMEKYLQEAAKRTHQEYTLYRREMIKAGAYTRLKNHLKTEKVLDFLLKKAKIKEGKRIPLGDLWR